MVPRRTSGGGGRSRSATRRSRRTTQAQIREAVGAKPAARFSSPVPPVSPAGTSSSHLAGSHDVVGWGRSTPRAGNRASRRWQAVDLLDRDRCEARSPSSGRQRFFISQAPPQVAESWRDADQAACRERPRHLSPPRCRPAGWTQLPRARHGFGCRLRASDTPITEDAPLAQAVHTHSANSRRNNWRCAPSPRRPGRRDGPGLQSHGPRQPPAFVAPSMARQIALIEKRRRRTGRCGSATSRRGGTSPTSATSCVPTPSIAHARQELAGSTTSASGVGTEHPVPARRASLAKRVEVRVEIDPERLRPAETSALVADTTRLRRPARAGSRTSHSTRCSTICSNYWRAEVRQARVGSAKEGRLW